VSDRYQSRRRTRDALPRFALARRLQVILEHRDPALNLNASNIRRLKICFNSQPLASADISSAPAAAGGKVIHDSRGNAIWDWAVATGVIARSKSSESLRMLDNPMLVLEGEYELGGEWAGDPYNRR
jgi:hypothetical protein